MLWSGARLNHSKFTQRIESMLKWSASKSVISFSHYSGKERHVMALQLKLNAFWIYTYLKCKWIKIHFLYIEFRTRLCCVGMCHRFRVQKKIVLCKYKPAMTTPSFKQVENWSWFQTRAKHESTLRLPLHVVPHTHTQPSLSCRPECGYLGFYSICLSVFVFRCIHLVSEALYFSLTFCFSLTVLVFVALTLWRMLVSTSRKQLTSL